MKPYLFLRSKLVFFGALAGGAVTLAIQLALWWRGPEPSVNPRPAAPPAPLVDFARLEHDTPLTRNARAALTPDLLVAMPQEQVDQIYARLTAGPIPDGPYDGRLFFPRDSQGATRLASMLTRHLASRLTAGLAARRAESLARLLWKGKVFDAGARLSRTRVDDLGPLGWFAGRALDGLAPITVDGRRTFLLFPGRVYCGQSLLDGRRESIVIDYTFTDELPGYREQPDALVGRHGLNLREELRMVRPGLYVGRAYADRLFVVNLVFVNDAQAAAHLADFTAGRIQEDC